MKIENLEEKKAEQRKGKKESRTHESFLRRTNGTALCSYTQTHTQAHTHTHLGALTHRLTHVRGKRAPRVAVGGDFEPVPNGNTHTSTHRDEPSTNNETWRWKMEKRGGKAEESGGKAAGKRRASGGRKPRNGKPKTDTKSG